MGTKDFDKGQGFDAECGICLLFQFVYSSAGSVGAGLGERGRGSPHPVSGPEGGALKAKGMAGSVVLQVTAGAPLCQGGVQEAGSTLNTDLGFISIPSIVLRQ